MTALQPNVPPRPLVLVVEDEHHVCELIAEILDMKGFDAVCAASDTEAMELLRARAAYRCLVLDVNLRHGLTGFDIARFARGLMPTLPVLFVSGRRRDLRSRPTASLGRRSSPSPSPRTNCSPASGRSWNGQAPTTGNLTLTHFGDFVRSPLVSVAAAPRRRPTLRRRE